MPTELATHAPGTVTRMFLPGRVEKSTVVDMSPVRIGTEGILSPALAWVDAAAEPVAVGVSLYSIGVEQNSGDSTVRSRAAGDVPILEMRIGREGATKAGAAKRAEWIERRGVTMGRL